jgi:hypothetical protein
MSGDLDTAAAALDGLGISGDPEDAEILLAQGHLAWLNSDFDRARDVAEEARRRVLGGDKHWQVLSVVALQGLLAHRRGEWFDRMRHELRRTRDVPEIANAVFDGYLCPAEYLLYGPTPYREVIDMAAVGQSRARRHRTGRGMRAPPRPGVRRRRGALPATARRSPRGRGRSGGCPRVARPGATARSLVDDLDAPAPAHLRHDDHCRT